MAQTGSASLTSFDGPSEGNATEVPLSDAWLGFDGVHGGYVASLAARCATKEANGLALRSLQATFLRPMRGPSALVRTRPVRRGRTTASFSASASGADGRGDAFVALMLFGEDGDGPDYAGTPMPTDKGPEDSEPYGPLDFVPFTRHLEVRCVNDARPFGGGAEARFVTWIRLDDAGLTGPQALLVLADALPPALYATVREPVALPSVDLSVHFTRDAEQYDPRGWHLVTMTTDFAGGGWSLDSSHVWSAGGTLLAAARQNRRVVTR